MTPIYITSKGNSSFTSTLNLQQGCCNTTIQGGMKSGSTTQHAGDERQQTVRSNDRRTEEGYREALIRLQG